MRFAGRTEFGQGETMFGEALRRARGLPGFVDLTVSNPTGCGLDYSGVDLGALSGAEVLRYAADPLGMESARQAVAGRYPGVDASRVLLTASTSEAYGFLLRLLCEPGDALLVPSPSYPLFDLLARMHDVEVVTYPLVYHEGWQVDPASLETAVTERTRAIVAIQPNNPTGHFCSKADRGTLRAVARARGLPLIVDEVSLEYPVEDPGEVSFAVEDAPVLTFAMGGLSKLLALPQMKLAWTVVCGPESEVREAMDRLEVIADTFLSVGTPVQVALPGWLAAGEKIREQIQSRVRGNLAVLDAVITGTAVSRLKVEGGWCAVVRVPALEQDEALAVRLAEQRGLAVHPGSLYGFAQRGWLVVSLLVRPEVFEEGCRRLMEEFA